MFSESWAAQQLAEFLAAVAATSDEQAALEAAVERAAEALEAEVGALVRHGQLVASVGFPAGYEPAESLVAVAMSEEPTAVIGDLGHWSVLRASFSDPTPSRLMVARLGEEPFARSEAGLLVAMARVLGLTVGSLRRQMMLERLALIQRAIARRAPLQDVLDAIAQGTHELLGDEVVGLRLLDPNDPSMQALRSTVGMDAQQIAAIRRSAVGEGIGGAAMVENGLVVWTDYPRNATALPPIAEAGLKTAMGAPIREEGVPVGSLVVGSYRPERHYSKVEQETLEVFAEQASLAINDARTVDALHRAVDEATHQALHDPLTGLPNRALFVDRLEHAIARASRTDVTVSVLFIDIDDFKLVNDGLGHTAGDELLVEVARRLAECVRTTDTAARLGGDEFAVVLEDVGSDIEAVAAARRVLDALQTPIRAGTEDVIVGASVGIAIASGDTEAGELLRNADVAMYRAKASGKGGSVVFEDEMYQALIDRRGFDGQLNHAIDTGGLCLHYQPIVDLEDGRPVGVEALVRWDHPTRGLLAPDQFVGAAEESGLIIPLGKWVLDEACRQLAAWRDEGIADPDLYVSVNVSAGELLQPGHAAAVASALSRHGLPPSAVVLEITETVFVRDTELTGQRLHALKNLGVRLALDDFGTGYSSLAYLRRFPVDILKIDKSFIDDVAVARGDAALAHAIVDLAAALDLQTLAEGVEHADQVTRLRMIGCELAQGFFYGRPSPPGEIAAVLGRAALPAAPRPALALGSHV